LAYAVSKGNGKPITNISVSFKVSSEILAQIHIFTDLLSDTLSTLGFYPLRCPACQQSLGAMLLSGGASNLFLPVICFSLFSLWDGKRTTGT
jgi:hypothetical protein